MRLSCVLYRSDPMDDQDMAWGWLRGVAFIRFFLSLSFLPSGFTIFVLLVVTSFWFCSDHNKRSDGIQDRNVIMQGARHPVPDLEHGITATGHEGRWRRGEDVNG